MSQLQCGGGFVKSLVLGLTFLFCLNASAEVLTDVVPECQAAGQVLPVNNAQVLQWKQTTKNQFHSRGHVQGKLVQIYPDHSGHHHFEVQIGATPADSIEVIYNEAFGRLPQTQVGDSVEACGDYITSTSQSGPYPASPDGAILHWIHRSPNGSHESGYLAINGTVCGQDSGHAPPKQGKTKHGAKPGSATN